MEESNEHGLSRDIPDPVKREVRQRSGFGCVVCGGAVYQYEHVRPPFSEATEHRAEGITLLCGGCHDRKTRRILSVESVLGSMKHPKSREQGFSFGPFDVQGHPDVLVGPFKAIKTKTVIRMFGETILGVDAPEELGGPFRLSAHLRDRDGNTTLSIQQNEWRTPSANWDVEVVGQTITVRRGPGHIAVRLRTDPPHALIVERLDMIYRGVRLYCSESEGLVVQYPSGKQFRLYAATGEECVAGIDVDADKFTVGYMCKRMHIGGITSSRA